MRVFIAIPIPLLILGAIVLNGVSDQDPPLMIPRNIDSDTQENQVEFGDRARKAKSYDLALEYCAKGEDSDDDEVQMVALTCMAWTHKAEGNVDEALAYLYRVREWEASQGFVSKYTSAEISELENKK
jgi:hypothetical protein